MAIVPGAQTLRSIIKWRWFFAPTDTKCSSWGPESLSPILSSNLDPNFLNESNMCDIKSKGMRQKMHHKLQTSISIPKWISILLLILIFINSVVLYSLKVTIPCETITSSSSLSANLLPNCRYLKKNWNLVREMSIWWFCHSFFNLHF